MRLLHRRDWRAVRSNQPFDGVDRPLRLFVHECEIVSLVLLEMDTATHQPQHRKKKDALDDFDDFDDFDDDDDAFLFNEEDEEKFVSARLLHPQRKRNQSQKIPKRREEKLLLKRPLTLAQRSSH